MTAQLPDPPTRAWLRQHLVATAIAGDVATSRENNLEHYELVATRTPYHLFGLEVAGTWAAPEVLALMVKKAGVHPDPGHTAGADTIDPDCTLDALEAMAGRLREAADRREDVVLATGHPAALLPVYIELARRLEACGCTLRTPGAGVPYATEDQPGKRQRSIRYVCGVAVLSAGGALHHTHSAQPMQGMLSELDGYGEPRPLVIADHGWAGAAGQAGLDVVGFADCNDPALFVGEAEGKVHTAVPLDDNVEPEHYAPMTAYLLAGGGFLGLPPARGPR